MDLAMTYCEGRGCLLKDSCYRYTAGQHIIQNREGDTFQYRFMDYCDPETRELFIDGHKE